MYVFGNIYLQRIIPKYSATRIVCYSTWWVEETNMDKADVVVDGVVEVVVKTVVSSKLCTLATKKV